MVDIVAARPGVQVGAGLHARAATEDCAVGWAHYTVECRRPDGALVWVEEFDNLVTTAGLTDTLDKYFKGSNYTAAWYVGLKGEGSANVADTMSSHGGWSEITDYDESVRETLTLGTPSSGAVDNASNRAEFTMNDSVTVDGAFIVSNSTKGGTSGTLYSVGSFTGGSRAVQDDDTLFVTVALTQANPS